MEVVWTEYMQYRLAVRGFELAVVERIVKYSMERYFDQVTGRSIAIGRHDERLVMIPYEADGDTVAPVTIHATTRQQINLRVKSGRFTNE